MAPRIANFPEWARHVVEGVRAEIARNPDDPLPPGHLGFAVPLRLRTPAGELRLMTTISTFATAVDVTISELRLEAFLPVDQATAALLAAVGESRPGPFGQKGL